MKDHTRYRATITSPGLQVSYLYGRSLESLEQRARAEVSKIHQWWRDIISVRFQVADNDTRDRRHRLRPNWRPAYVSPNTTAYLISPPTKEN